MGAGVVRLATRRRGVWRAAVGGVLRDWRTEQGLRLADVAERAGVSTQYLSEVERGRKEASSEVLGAVTEALGSSLADLALGVAAVLDGRGHRSASRGTVLVLRTTTAQGAAPSSPERSPGTALSSGSPLSSPPALPLDSALSSDPALSSGAGLAPDVADHGAVLLLAA